MRGFQRKKGETKIRDLLSTLEYRKLPLVREEATVEELLRMAVKLEHRRVLYVVNEVGEIQGVIPASVLMRHVFSLTQAPRVHGRLLPSMITAETAKDLMRRKPVSVTANESVEETLKKMIDAHAEEIPVLDEAGKVVGDLGMIDFFEFLLGQMNEG